MVGSRKQSISALQLQKDCRIGCYESAWLLLQRIRQSLHDRPGRSLRGPHVEVDEPIIEHGDGVRPASPSKRQTVVALAIERWKTPRSHARVCGSLRVAAHISDLHVTFAFIEAALRDAEPTVARGLLARTIAANLGAWLAGTFHGVSDKYMFAYVREYAFRFNRRRRERWTPELIASALLRGGPRRAASLTMPSDLEYPLSGA